MAGLFELQLPNESRRRRSSDVVDPRRSTSTRSDSPTPEDTAREIVTQLVAKQQSSPSQSTLSSIFPWRRKASATVTPTGLPSTTAERKSADARIAGRSLSPDDKTQKNRSSSRLTIGKTSASPRPSLSADSTRGLSSSLVSPSASHNDGIVTGDATKALAQAGLGLSLPHIAFPGSTSPISKHIPKRKKSARPGTSHGNESADRLVGSSTEGSIRRVRSFSKLQDNEQSVSRTEPLPLPQSASMPEIPSNQGSRKGKEPELQPEVDYGRQNQGAFSLFQKDHDKTVARRTSWWPGRRPADPSPVDTRPPLSTAAPPPLPARSQHRPPPPIKAPAPTLPSFQPFSPLLNDFPVSTVSNSNGSPPERQTANGLWNEYDDARSNPGPSVPSNDQMKDSLEHRIFTGPLDSFPPKHPSKQVSRTTPQVRSRSHRHSHSFGSSDFGHLSLSANLFRENLASSQSSEAPLQRPKSAVDTSSGTVERRRSLTIFGRPSSPVTRSLVSSRDGLLLLRQPVSRLSVGAELRSSDPRLSRSEFGLEYASTSSLTNLSQSLVKSRTARPRSGTIPSTSSFGGSTSSLPPATSSGRLLRRLSSNFFTTPSTPIVTSSVDPSSVSSLIAPGPLNAAWSSTTSSSGRSKESLGDDYKAFEEGAQRKAGKVPTRLPDETPEHFLSRLTNSIGRGEIVHVLAGSGDEFYLKAMSLYFSRFNFTGDPLDVAVRRLLMEIGLPRETQQIDRVMEAFAARYLKCNPELFVDKDHPYILAFSLIMLHTDAFNKSNKNKMTKADYVKNAKLPGIPTEVLECFFDNIIFAPFIFIEDPEDIPSKNQVNEGPLRFSTSGSPSTMLPPTSGGGTLLGKSNKIDPYYLITRNLLDPLRADIDSHIPKKNPYLYEGTDWPWDTQHLRQLFARAQQVQVNADSFSASVSVPSSGTSTPARRKSIAMPSFAMGYGPFIATQSFTAFEFPAPQRPTAGRPDGMRMIRIAKAGVLSRKDDTIEGGKRAVNRKWREWSVVLTATQLLFFRDLSFASQLLGLTPGGEFQDLAIQEALLHPDEVVSLYEAIAVFDTTYIKKPHAFRLFLPNGRQFITQCSEEHALNEWISAINYAGAFRSAGVRMRGIGISHKEAEMMGFAAAASHLSDRGVSARVLTLPLASTLTSTSLITPISSSPQPLEISSHSPQLNPSSELLKALSSTPSRRYEETLQLKNTFEEVKAELAASTPLEEFSREMRSRTPTSPSTSSTRTRTLSVSARAPPTPSAKQTRRPSTASSTTRSEEKVQTQTIPRSRVDVVQSRALLLDSQIKQIQRDLDDELRIVRNLAILTPFQRASRDRIQSAVINVAKKVRSLRIGLTKHVCHHFVLLSDLAEEEREREQAKRDAMEAATRRLSIADGRPLQIITSSHHYEPTSSSYESFHSALDGSERNESTMSVLGSVFTSEPRPLHQNTTTPTQSPIPMHAELGLSPATEGHEKFYTAVETPEEIAEEWNETRAAKRVSLVRVPSEVRLAILNRQFRVPSDEST